MRSPRQTQTAKTLVREHAASPSPRCPPPHTLVAMQHQSSVSPLACNEAVNRISNALRRDGFQVERSFDLQSARNALRAPQECACPHHGTAECSCQYVVLLVQRGAGPPVSLIAHGREGQTAFTVEPSGDRDQFERRLWELIEGLELNT